MTDEEKAEEYLGNLDDCRTKELMKTAYLDGLAEGRKERNENIKKIQEFRKIDQKQILEQMDNISELEKENAEQKKQIDQLSNDNHVLKTAFITQQEQIEKMRNCSNCNGIKPNGMRSEKCDFCFKGKDFINWELAE